MYTNNITQYLSMIKKRGLAVNNLYMVEISLPTALMSMGAKMYMSGYSNQLDTNKEIDNNGPLAGLINPQKYSTGARNIINSLGLGKDEKPTSPIGNRMNYDATEKVCVLCVAAELPFYKQKVNNAFYNHMTHKMVTGIDTDAVNLTFYIDRDNLVLTMFEAWQNLINNNQQENQVEGMLSYKSEYAANELSISLINKSHTDPRNTYQDGELEKYYTTTLVGAFPSFINPIRVNNGTSELLQLQVTIEYDKIRHKAMDLTSEDPVFEKEIATGFNIIDMKNKMGDAISEGRNMINNVRNDIKTGAGVVDEASRTTRNILR